jgi:hypothetical protein
MFTILWLTLCTIGCHDIVNRLGSHDVHTHAHTHTLNVRRPSGLNWPDDGSIGTETCCLLYFNKLYVSVVFRRNILPTGKRFLFSPVTQQPLVGQGLLFIEASRSQSDTSRSVGLL